MPETNKMILITLENLTEYHGLLEAYIGEEIATSESKSLKTVAIEGNVLKFYKVEEPVGDTEPAYEITLPEQDLSHLMSLVEGAVEGNIATFDANGQVVDSGLVAAEIAKKSEVKEVDDKVALNTEAIELINDDENGILKQAQDYADGKDTAISAAQEAANKAQDEVDAVEKRMTSAEEAIGAIEEDMGSVDDLQTTNKTVAGAINEVLAAVGTGGTAAVVTVTTDTTTEGALKSYTIKQGNTTVGVIDIPKDMVVESGSVVVDPEGQEAGTYIKLVLANVAEPLFINVGRLVDIYTVEAEATQVQLAIDTTTRAISATIVAGSITAAELAADAVTTIKIADGNVTKAKLSTEVQASLDKADAAVPQATYDEKVASLEQADTDLGARLTELEKVDHDHANKEELDLIESGDKAKWDEAAEKAHEHENKAELDKVLEGDVARWNAAHESLEEGGATANAIVEAKKAGTDAQAHSEGVAEDLAGEIEAREASDERIEALEGLVGEGFAGATSAQIAGLFA